MPISENTARRLVLKSGSTTLTLDRDTGKAVMQRKIMFWNAKPVETSLADISDVSIDVAVDRASGAEFHSTMLIQRSGAGWALPASDKADAERNASAIRDFLARPA